MSNTFQSLRRLLPLMIIMALVLKPVVVLTQNSLTSKGNPTSLKAISSSLAFQQADHASFRFSGPFCVPKITQKEKPDERILAPDLAKAKAPTFAGHPFHLVLVSVKSPSKSFLVLRI